MLTEWMGPEVNWGEGEGTLRLKGDKAPIRCYRRFVR